MHWCICLLHLNELPLRHLVEILDGKTAGPRSYTGNLGKELNSCHELPLIEFQTVSSPHMPVLPPDVLKTLSTDQKYLYEIVQMVATGRTSNVASQTPGPLAHSRWVTTAARILRLYVSTHAPNAKLKMLVKYVMNVYAPAWFLIRMKPGLHFGTAHFIWLWNSIYVTLMNHKAIQEKLLDVLKRNSFFAHTEQMIVCMLGDERREVRLQGLEYLQQVRAAEIAQESRRNFTKPDLKNGQLLNYENIWDSNRQKSDPPLLKGTPLWSLRRQAEANAITFSDYPCHTQGVERMVRLVSEAAASVYGTEARDGWIRNTLNSRESMPSFNSKKDFKV